ncbi:MAG: type II secretion system GspH family protein [Opitutales bacterium]|nr:type II secretion system GspH family protein [Opitutales bacterium]
MNRLPSANLAAYRSPLSCRPRGFTLIELLVVVAVLGILAAISFPVFSAVQNRARVSQTRSQFNQYITAMEGYRSEYGYYPTFRLFTELDTPLSGDHHVRLNEFPNRREIFSVSLTGRRLNGERVSDDSFLGRAQANPRRHEFYEFSESEFNVDGEFVDAFGNPDIRIVIDTDYNGQISADALNGLSLDQDFIRTGVAIYSVGNPNAGFPEVRSW